MQAVLSRFGMYLRRRRHTGGFGVHSPFAFRFITEVLNQRHQYYSYEYLSPAGHMRTVFRICLALKPATVAIFEGLEGYRAAVEAACPSAKIVSADKADLIVARHSDSRLCEYACNGRHLIAIGKPGLAWRNACKSLPYGMTFTSPSIAVAVALKHLPRQDFFPYIRQ